MSSEDRPESPAEPAPAGEPIPTAVLVPRSEFDPLTSEGGLTGATISSGAWRTISVFGGAAMQFTVAVVLARLLAPGDFGTLALVQVVTGLVNTVVIIGLGYPLVQREALSKAHVQTAWTLALAIGVVMTALISGFAPWLARLVGDPGSTWVFVALSPYVLLGAMQVCSLNLMKRQLRFRQLMLIELVSYGIGYGPIALVGAALGWGIWSLVAGLLVQGFILAVGAYWLSRHPVGLRVDRRAARDLLGLGSAAAASGLTSYVALNGDNFVVGRMLGTTPLGLYTRAYYMMNLPLTYFAQILSHVMLPAYSRVQRDRTRMNRAYIVSVYTVFLLAAPVMMFVLVGAPHLIRGLFGEQWVGVVEPLQILAVFGGLRAIYHLGGPLVQGSGRPGAELIRQIMYAALVLIGAMIGSYWGITGVAWGIGCAITAMYFAMAQLSHKVAGFRWRTYASVHATGFIAGAIMLGVGFAVRYPLRQLGWPDLAIVVALGVLLVIVVALTAGLLPRAWRPEGAEHALRLMLNKLPGRLGKWGRFVLRLGEGL